MKKHLLLAAGALLVAAAVSTFVYVNTQSGGRICTHGGNEPCYI